MNHNLSFESLIFVIMRVIFIYTPEAMMVHTENSNKIKILWMSILLFAVLSTFYCQNTPTSPPVYINRALSFDGMDDIVTVPAVGTMLDSLSTQFTIESWIYIRSYPQPGTTNCRQIGQHVWCSGGRPHRFWTL